jgi:hypothetical protein
MSERMKLESLALEVAIIAFLGASVFVNRLYAEMLYWLLALSVALTNIHHTEMAGAQSSLDDAPPAARAA